MRWAVLVLLAAALGVAGCDGEPLGDRSIVVALGYQDRTNAGAVTARGLAQIETSGGTVVLELQGLEPLGETLRYEGWLAGGGERPLSLGRFAVDGSGNETVVAVLGPLAESTFDRVELTIEDEPDRSPKPDVRISIGGPIE